MATTYCVTGMCYTCGSPSDIPSDIQGYPDDNTKCPFCGGTLHKEGTDVFQKQEDGE